MIIVNSSDRVLRLKQVQEKTGLGRSTIYDRLNPRSARFDNSFPRVAKAIAGITWRTHSHTEGLPSGATSPLLTSDDATNLID